MKLAFGDGHHHFPAHHLALMVGIAVIFSGQVMAITAERFMGCKFFKPALVIMVQPWLVIIDDTEAVICIALTRHIPSRIPLSLNASSISWVMLTKSIRAGTSIQSSL